MDATTSTDMFDAHEHDFHELLEGVRRKLDPVEGAGQSVEQRKAGLRRVELELDEADEMVSQMELEFHGIPISIRPSYQARIKGAKADLQRYKKLSKDLHAQASRTELLTRSGSPYTSSDDPYGSNDRTRLLAGTASLEDGSRRLQDSHRVALETEEQGSDVLQALRRQREQIQNSRDTLDRADNSITRAGGTLKKMITGMYRQRIVFGAMTGFLAVVVVGILWFKLVR